MVSQPESSSEKSPYYDIARDFGVDIVFRPFIKVEGLSPERIPSAENSAARLHRSGVHVAPCHRQLLHLAREMRITIPETMKVLLCDGDHRTVHPKVVQYRKRKVFFRQHRQDRFLLPTMVKHKDERYLVPMSNVNNGSVSAVLSAKKPQLHRVCHVPHCEQRLHR